MLGRLRMSTQEALQEYDNCAAAVFSCKNIKNPTAWFRASGLKKVVEELVAKRGMGDLMQEENPPNKGKVLVCVMPTKSWGEARIIRSWEPSDPDSRWHKNTTIWQAARATTAASIYFKPEVLGNGKEDQPFIDAAIGANNPVEYLLKEAVRHFGSGKPLGCVVSIGTGTREVEIASPPKGLLKGWINPLPYVASVAKLLKTSATDPEHAHRSIAYRVEGYPGAYFRFNVTNAAAVVGLSQYKKIPELKSLTVKYLSDPDIIAKIREAADKLRGEAFDHGLSLGYVSMSSLDLLNNAYFMIVSAKTKRSSPS
ncbi:uncharacterized protein CTHT_0060960 [Thermochaetoides thermophila DSM 1495]|uniref:PNPLA domain-containing protein n=1 Tax=Chaetomium thermophilum (strain DSM 1495 / CBS 144.50 / IMI 039719) TaxID=759272 RepID=G0SF65_CHATD|nr:hypothetical protein CTHT_0060960 [Thermochaetoides thermophila DSM 1495]EGS18081.1 hypothetical protein CTHT_0060960 [Thermochaetoides thermophila DSM 1495]